MKETFRTADLKRFTGWKGYTKGLNEVEHARRGGNEQASRRQNWRAE
jgi:hypothetical protein